MSVNFYKKRFSYQQKYLVKQHRMEIHGNTLVDRCPSTSCIKQHLTVNHGTTFAERCAACQVAAFLILNLNIVGFLRASSPFH